MTNYASFKEVLISYFNRYPYTLLPLYTKAYKNPLIVALKSALRHYPFTAYLKNGDKVIITGKGYKIASYYAFLYLSHKKGKKINIIDMDENTIKVIYDTHEIIFKDYTAGDVIGVYVKEEYQDINVKDKTIIDCGAAIGDSAIYFSLKGAKRVIAIEAYPKIAKVAEENVKLNNLTNIQIVNAACGIDGFITVDSRLGGGPTPLINTNNGYTVPSYSLKSIIKNFQIEKGSVLKLDCEGCEYDFILNEDISTLEYFDQIIMEYHYGYSLLKGKLENAGFKVKVTKPELCDNQFRRGLILGKLYAFRES